MQLKFVSVYQSQELVTNQIQSTWKFLSHVCFVAEFFKVSQLKQHQEQCKPLEYFCSKTWNKWRTPY